MKYFLTIIGMLSISCASFAAGTSEPFCFDKVAKIAADKMRSDAQGLFENSSVAVDVFKVEGGSETNGNFAEEDMPESGIKNFDGWIHSWVATGRAVGDNGDPGSRTVEDKIVVYLKANCSPLGASRKKEDTFVGCFGSCAESSIFNKDVLNALYRAPKK